MARETPPNTEPTLADRIADDLEQGAHFEKLALEAFAFQYERLPPYRQLCESRQITPTNITAWEEIPPLPIAAFKHFDLHTDEPREVFRSSGTTGSQRSVHRHPFPDLYRRTIDLTFPRYCLPNGSSNEKIAMLSLIPSRQQAPESSLGFMADHVLNKFGTAASQIAFSERGVDIELANRWLLERIEKDERVLILSTAFALVQWLEALEASGESFEVPAESTIFETGGFKGRVREIQREELLSWLATRLGVSPRRVVREYGMTELTGQFYTEILSGGDPDRFVAPPFMRARLLDPVSLETAKPGDTGLVTIFDLSNVGSAVHLMTEDLGVADGSGFRLLGRAGEAELRGCSLTVEALAFEEN